MDKPQLTDAQLAAPLRRSDIAALTESIGPIVRDYLARELQPLVQRLVDLEHKAEVAKAEHDIYIAPTIQAVTSLASRLAALEGGR
jgi:hypothetical protein